MSQQKWPGEKDARLPIAPPPAPSPAQPRPSLTDFQSSLAKGQLSSGQPKPAQLPKQPEPKPQSKRIICPRCGRPGINMYIVKRGRRSYIYVYHGKDGNDKKLCYVGPAKKYLHVITTSNPSQSSHLLGRRAADDMYTAVEAAVEFLRSKGYEVILLGPARSGKPEPWARGPQQAPDIQQGDQRFASSPDLWSRVFQAEVGEKVICPLCGREGIKRIWKTGNKYHIFIYHPKNSRCYIAPVDGYVRRRKV